MATGTGSGKTEAFLVPVVAHAFAQRHRPGVKAIALYPMNALVNDQEDRVRTACEALGLRYGVYTGATPQHERARMQENPPDILLTNYSMLEFILTRREDRKLFGAGVLRHLVLDEIHTYQGALGSEIACLVRRLRGHVDVDGPGVRGPVRHRQRRRRPRRRPASAPRRSPRTCSPPRSARTRSWRSPRSRPLPRTRR